MNTIKVVVVAFFFVLLLGSIGVCDDKISTKVLLGLTIDGQGSIVASDPQIEYTYPNIEKVLTADLVKNYVRYLPPLSVNHEDRVTGTCPVTPEYNVCTTSIQDAFQYALKKYAGETTPDKYVLLVAKRVTPESRPLISVWWFSFIDKDNLPKEERK